MSGSGVVEDSEARTVWKLKKRATKGRNNDRESKEGRKQRPKHVGEVMKRESVGG